MSWRMTVVAMLLIWTSAQAQEFKGPIWGGAGGPSSYNLDCGSTGVMVGVYGRTGSWIDQIGVTCQSVNADGTLGNTFTRGPVGGAGGAGRESRCEAGRVVGALQSWSGMYVEALTLSCFPWIAATSRPKYDVQAQWPKFGTVGQTVTFGPLTLNQSVTCPSEKVGKALRGRFGGYIDSLQFVCDDYNK